MNGFKQMMYLYRTHKQVRDIQLFAHWSGLSFEAAFMRWCAGGCAKFWNENN